MSVDLLSSDREIVFVNLTAVGTESKNGHQSYCKAKQTYRDAPVLYNQSAFLCAATRWQVPTSEVPTIEPTWFEIWEYQDGDFEEKVELEDGSEGVATVYSYTKVAQMEAAREQYDMDGMIIGGFKPNYQLARRFEVPACHSAYQWFGVVEGLLHEKVSTEHDANGNVIYDGPGLGH